MIDQNPNSRKPGLLGVVTAMSFAVTALAFSSVFITSLERASVPPLVIAFYRVAIASALLWPAVIAVRRREIASLGRKDLGLMILGGLCLAIHFGAWITSLKYVPIATSVVLVNTHPLLVVIGSYVFLGEKLEKHAIVGAVLGIAGMLVMSHAALADFQVALRGNGLALVGALAVVGYFIVGRKARTRLSLLGYVTPLYTASAIFLLLPVLIAGDPLGPYGASSWAYLIALAVVPTVIGHTVFNWAIKYVRPAAISVMFLGEPVVASVLAFIFFSQRPAMTTFIGGILVLAGVYLSMRKRGGGSET